MLKLSARANEAFSFNIVPRQSHPGYQGLATSSDFELGTTWVHYSFAFEITTADTSCRLDFGWDHTLSTKFWIDNVALYALPPADSTLGPRSALFYNVDTASALVVNPSKGGRWLDILGLSHSGNSSLNPLGALIVIHDQNRLPHASTHLFLFQIWEKIGVGAKRLTRTRHTFLV